MRKQAALWTCIALAISVVFVVRTVLAGYHLSGIYLLVPILAYACALAIYTGFMSGPWFSSITWLLNGIMAMATGGEAAFNWHTLLRDQPFHFVVILLLLVPS